MTSQQADDITSIEDKKDQEEMSKHVSKDRYDEKVLDIQDQSS